MTTRARITLDAEFHDGTTPLEILAWIRFRLGKSDSLGPSNIGGLHLDDVVRSDGITVAVSQDGSPAP